MIRAVLCGMGSFLPGKVITNDDLSNMVDTTDEWIVRRTGIKNRRIAESGETTSYMAYKAAEAAIQDSGIEGSEIDLIVVATATPDKTLPSVATMLQGKIGCVNAFAFDINAACSGFVYALSIVDAFIRSGQVKTALLVGSETMSKVVDWKDRSTCVLFGDGAGACVFKAKESSGADRGIVSSILRSDGSLTDVLYTDGGVGTTNTFGCIRMKGTVLFEYAVTRLYSVIRDILHESGTEIDKIDLFIPHQANVRIIDSLAKKLGFSSEKIVLALEEHANTSAASIPLAMHYAKQEGRLREGQLILLAAVGAGITWGATLLRL